MNPFTSYRAGICSLDVNSRGQLLIGTQGGELFLQTKQFENSFRCILQGHYDGEVWGLATHPSKKQMVTSGGDKTIRVWDVMDYKMIVGTRP